MPNDRMEQLRFGKIRSKLAEEMGVPEIILGDGKVTPTAYEISMKANPNWNIPRMSTDRVDYMNTLWLMGFEPMPSQSGTVVMWESCAGSLIRLFFTEAGDYLGFHMEIK